MQQNIDVDETSGKLSWRINLKAIHDNFFNLIGFVKISDYDSKNFYKNPILVLIGQNSLSYGTDPFNLIFPDFDGIRDVKYIKDAKHWIHVDNPKDFLESISEFINHNY
jgi:pimeloyl-ACP methyl ester carboxylesterase